MTFTLFPIIEKNFFELINMDMTLYLEAKMRNEL
jgi:hypothetical protein